MAQKSHGIAVITRRKISTIFFNIENETFNLSEGENELLKKLKFYYKRTWIVGEKESVFSAENATNNGAEAYHKTLKLFVKVHHPNIWNFLSDLDKISRDYENEYQRLEQGLQITRKSSTKNIENAKCRKECKEKLQDGTFSTAQYLTATSLTIGHTSKLHHEGSMMNQFTVTMTHIETRV